MAPSGQSRMLETVVTKEISQNPKVRKIQAIFLNRKPLEVRYYYEAKGTDEKEGNIMIDTDSLAPIFRPFCPTATQSYKSLDNLCAFVNDRIRFDQCSDYQYADCICHLLRNHADQFTKAKMRPSSGCWSRHFHHACWSCVNYWLLEYLRMLILHRESIPLFTMAAQEICSRVFIEEDDFKKNFHQYDPEFYLWIAQRWTNKEYLRHDIIKAWR